MKQVVYERIGHILLLGFLMLLSGTCFYLTFRFHSDGSLASPSVLPRVWTLLLFGFSLWKIRGVIREEIDPLPSSMHGVWSTLLMFSYLILIPIVGFRVATLLFLVSMSWVLSRPFAKGI